LLLCQIKRRNKAALTVVAGYDILKKEMDEMSAGDVVINKMTDGANVAEH
jgi:hypothetical protein